VIDVLQQGLATNTTLPSWQTQDIPGKSAAPILTSSYLRCSTAWQTKLTPKQTLTLIKQSRQVHEHWLLAQSRQGWLPKNIKIVYSQYAVSDQLHIINFERNSAHVHMCSQLISTFPSAILRGNHTFTSHGKCEVETAEQRSLSQHND
jgi:hypothetical protein